MVYNGIFLPIASTIFNGNSFFSFSRKKTFKRLEFYFSACIWNGVNFVLFFPSTFVFFGKRNNVRVIKAGTRVQYLSLVSCFGTSYDFHFGRSFSWWHWKIAILFRFNDCMFCDVPKPYPARRCFQIPVQSRPACLQLLKWCLRFERNLHNGISSICLCTPSFYSLRNRLEFFIRYISILFLLQSLW